MMSLRDRQIDMTKLVVAFRSFANAPNNDDTLPAERSNIPYSKKSESSMQLSVQSGLFPCRGDVSLQITFTEASNKNPILYKTQYRRKTSKRLMLRTRSEL
jgi:hypothetical protein